MQIIFIPNDTQMIYLFFNTTRGRCFLRQGVMNFSFIENAFGWSVSSCAYATFPHSSFQAFFYAHSVGEKKTNECDSPLYLFFFSASALFSPSPLCRQKEEKIKAKKKKQRGEHNYSNTTDTLPIRSPYAPSLCQYRFVIIKKIAIQLNERDGPSRTVDEHRHPIFFPLTTLIERDPIFFSTTLNPHPLSPVPLILFSFF